jgi:hypothetical protein
MEYDVAPNAERSSAKEQSREQSSKEQEGHSLSKEANSLNRESNEDRAKERDRTHDTKEFLKEFVQDKLGEFSKQIQDLPLKEMAAGLGLAIYMSAASAGGTAYGQDQSHAQAQDKGHTQVAMADKTSSGHWLKEIAHSNAVTLPAASHTAALDSFKHADFLSTNTIAPNIIKAEAAVDLPVAAIISDKTDWKNQLKSMGVPGDEIAAFAQALASQKSPVSAALVESIGSPVVLIKEKTATLLEEVYTNFNKVYGKDAPSEVRNSLFAHELTHSKIELAENRAIAALESGNKADRDTWLRSMDAKIVHPDITNAVKNNLPSSYVETFRDSNANNLYHEKMADMIGILAVSSNHANAAKAQASDRQAYMDKNASINPELYARYGTAGALTELANSFEHNKINPQQLSVEQKFEIAHNIAVKS